jgi:hypothetical protein
VDEEEKDLLLRIKKKRTSASVRDEQEKKILLKMGKKTIATIQLLRMKRKKNYC